LNEGNDETTDLDIIMIIKSEQPFL
jgi:hypothetical protein